ncbi:LPXTG cell wall anchor domain-containing protein [Erysipelothrix sp. HDW6C]|uniref:leucine-rich repeat domain-containing protein n=1 Tax=Erysipelothrix sp. HDW6C TaxID=2714930 RepID=UPI00140830D2|nr:leucine-rich repeat domain-containing protein [Erysipelothrix sp. HDW6C]QIK69393.1 LPXTG cell wall anchor domain-containing protein [Erysipelothrix sp. HDW6C]
MQEKMINYIKNGSKVAVLLALLLTGVTKINASEASDEKDESAKKISTEIERIDSQLPSNITEIEVEKDVLITAESTEVEQVSEFNEKSIVGRITDLFQDQNLAEAVAVTLGYSSVDENLTTEDVQKLTILKANDAGIKSLEGIQILTNIRSITLQRNEITNLSPLDSLPKLIGLDLSSNNISDIGTLETIPSLISIAFSDNQISDISALAPLTKLKTVYLSRNLITDMSPLAGLVSIATLSLESNKIEDISYLSTLKGLVNLYISNGQGSFANLEPLSTLENLKELYSSNNQIVDISPLKNISSLEKVVLYSNRITDIEPLQGLSNLSFITLSYNNINDISALEGLTNVTQLYLRGNYIHDISPISNYYQNLTDYDFRDQTIKLDSTKLMSNVSVSNPIINIDQKNTEITFSRISDGGVSSNEGISWSGLINQQRTSFNFNNGDMFTGTVYHPFKQVDVHVAFIDESGVQLLSPQAVTYEIDETFTISAPKIDGYEVVDNELFEGAANTQSKHTFVYMKITLPNDTNETPIDQNLNTDTDQNIQNANKADETATLPKTGIQNTGSLVMVLGVILTGSGVLLVLRKNQLSKK